MEDYLLTTQRFKDKVCLITGSSRGIGYSIAEKLGLEGAKVIIASRVANNVQKAERSLKAQSISVTAIVCDFNNKEDRKKLFSTISNKFDRLDVLVCNVAASPHFGHSYNIEEKEYDIIFDVNVKNTFFTVKEALPLLRKSKNSNILFISSQAAYHPFEQIGVYSVSKTSILGLTKVLARELADFSMRVNCVAPGIIDTKRNSNFADGVAKNFGNFIGRAGLPEEVANVAAFLCSSEASFITGETICINGGLHGRL